MPRLRSLKSSDRVVYASQREYASVKSSVKGLPVLLDQCLTPGMVYAVWPKPRAGRISSARTVWFTARRYYYEFKPRLRS